MKKQGARRGGHYLGLTWVITAAPLRKMVVGIFRKWVRPNLGQTYPNPLKTQGARRVRVVILG